MTHPRPIDPELRLLLDEIAIDPKAKLFRTEIPRPERLLLTGVEPLKPTSTGLTSAERHLLRIYREDVAQILRDAAEWKIQQDPLGEALASTYLSPIERRQVCARDELILALQARQRGAPESVQGSVALSLALMSEETSVDGVTRIHQLAGLALRLSAHDSAWVQIGRGLILEAKMSSALQCLSGVARRGQSRAMQVSALTCIGSAYGSLGRSENSSTAYSAASALAPNDPNCVLSELVESVLANDEATATSAIERVDDMLSPESPCTLDWISGLQERRVYGRPWSMSSSSLRLAHMLMEHSGSSGRMVINEIL